MDRQTNIKKVIETQREKLDRMAAEQTDDLTGLLDEARRMDRMIEAYEDQKRNL